MYQEIESLDIRKFMSISISARRKHDAHAFQAKFIQAYRAVESEVPSSDSDSGQLRLSDSDSGSDSDLQLY